MFYKKVWNYRLRRWPANQEQAITIHDANFRYNSSVSALLA